MYDELAAWYHLIFADWETSMAIGLARRGHAVTGSDISQAAIARAAAETAARGLDIPLYAADLRDLSAVPVTAFDAVLIADNAIAHLDSEEDLRMAAAGALRKLRPGGVLLATVRDYDILVRDRPVTHGPAFFEDAGRRRIVHQVWDWTAERRYTMHLYITSETDGGWVCRHFSFTFHAVGRSAVTGALQGAGFVDVRWLEPGESGFYQPVVLARAPGGERVE